MQTVLLLLLLLPHQGKIRQDGSGLATFKANFQCITFRPFKGEVLDCVVVSVNKVGAVNSSSSSTLGIMTIGRKCWTVWCPA
jgi:DNA-directed RNA polymerase subunit E'/Rpb7